jgi:hypothetical protein
MTFTYFIFVAVTLKREETKTIKMTVVRTFGNMGEALVGLSMQSLKF